MRSLSVWAMGLPRVWGATGTACSGLTGTLAWLQLQVGTRMSSANLALVWQ